MRFMIIRKSDANMETGALPDKNLLAAVGLFIRIRVSETPEATIFLLSAGRSVVISAFHAVTWVSTRFANSAWS